MEKEIFHDLMGENILVIILKIKNMDLVLLFGQMDVSMKAIGNMESSMEKENI